MYRPVGLTYLSLLPKKITPEKMAELAELYLPHANRVGLDVFDVRRQLHITPNLIKKNHMFETGTNVMGLIPAFSTPSVSPIQAPRQRTHRSRYSSSTENQYFPDENFELATDIVRLREIQRNSFWIRIALLAALVALIISTLKK